MAKRTTSRSQTYHGVIRLHGAQWLVLAMVVVMAVHLASRVSIWPLLIGIPVLGLLLCLLLRIYRLDIGSDSFSHRNPVHGTQVVAYADISRAWFESRSKLYPLMGPLWIERPGRLRLPVFLDKLPTAAGVALLHALEAHGIQLEYPEQSKAGQTPAEMGGSQDRSKT